jgi:hypothetical protein
VLEHLVNKKEFIMSFNHEIAALILQEAKKVTPPGRGHDFSLPGFPQNDVSDTAI